MNLTQHTTPDLRAELTRIQAATTPASMVFGAYANHRYAVQAIQAELARRQDAAAETARRSALEAAHPALPADPPRAVTPPTTAHPGRYGQPESATTEIQGGMLCTVTCYPPRG